MDEEQLILFVLYGTPHLKTPNYSNLLLYEKICEEVGQLIKELTTYAKLIFIVAPCILIFTQFIHQQMHIY